MGGIDLPDDIDWQTGLLGNGFHCGTTRPEQVGCPFGSTVISGHFLVRIFCKTGNDGDDCRHNESEDDEEWCSYWMLHGFFPFCFPLVAFENDLRTAEECETVGFTYLLRIVDFLQELFPETPVFHLGLHTGIL